MPPLPMGDALPADASADTNAAADVQLDATFEDALADGGDGIAIPAPDAADGSASPTGADATPDADDPDADSGS